MKKTLLYLSFSPREDSISTSLADGFVAQWQTVNKDAQVLRHALGQDGVTGPDDVWIKANMTPADERSPEQVACLAFSEKTIDELHQASHILIASPMHNFSIPWTFKAYIDLIVRAGKTFSFDPQKGPSPLLDRSKKLLLVRSSAFDYKSGTPSESFDLMLPYLKLVFGFMGVTNLEIVDAFNQWAGVEAAEASREQASSRLAELSARW